MILSSFDEVTLSEKIYWFCVEAWWNNHRWHDTTIPFGGWGHGYVAIPHWHPWYKVDTDLIPCTIHGGITYTEMYNEMWIVGFDTGHFQDTPEKWPVENVEKEAKRLYKQAMQCDWTYKLVE